MKRLQDIVEKRKEYLKNRTERLKVLHDTLVKAGFIAKEVNHLYTYGLAEIFYIEIRIVEYGKDTAHIEISANYTKKGKWHDSIHYKYNLLTENMDRIFRTIESVSEAIISNAEIPIEKY